jgi:hypothetical protein
MTVMGQGKAQGQDGSGKPGEAGRSNGGGRRSKDDRPCPNPLKGQVCQVCGGAYVCLQSWRRKADAPA